MQQYASDPEALQESLEGLDDFLQGLGETVSLRDTNRDASWAEMGG